MTDTILIRDLPTSDLRDLARSVVEELEHRRAEAVSLTVDDFVRMGDAIDRANVPQRGRFVQVADDGVIPDPQADLRVEVNTTPTG